MEYNTDSSEYAVQWSGMGDIYFVGPMNKSVNIYNGGSVRGYLNNFRYSQGGPFACAYIGESYSRQDCINLAPAN